ncbi:MAG: type III-B CRISPR module RAMP protein Cmr4 [Actinomycetota bacterium]|nr:type III-B CRISPR module RAMP protein Cmr4 [Actinomycetota bacterium]
MLEKHFITKTYLGLALDPIHIGTGGYRFGRVDNTIVRDFDDVPKIPGTSIEGSARSYAAMRLNRLELCGGKDRAGKKCPEQNYRCRVCVSFGYTNSELVPEDKPKSLGGMAQFSDVKILFFPIASLVGPVWVSCPSKLREIKVDETKWEEIKESEYCVLSDYLKEKLKNVGYLNFGWLMLQFEKKDGDIITHSIDKNTSFGQSGLTFEARGLDRDEIFNRLVLVSDLVFPQIVNSNLEVRTSVSIDPETGAAESGALFTYEAIPRGTVFAFDIIYQNPDYFNVAHDIKQPTIVKTVEWGMGYFEFLGIGGMGTRGFGKLKVLGLDQTWSERNLLEIEGKTIQNLKQELVKVQAEIEKKEKEEEKLKLRRKEEQLNKEISLRIENLKRKNSDLKELLDYSTQLLEELKGG